MIELDKIYNEDCLIGMQRIPDGSVDAIICDLPYGTTACKWDSVIPFEPLWKEYKRICKKFAPIILTAREPFTSMLVMSNIKNYKHKWVWNKKLSGCFFHAKHMPLPIEEDVLVFGFDSHVNYYPIMRKGKMRYKGGATETPRWLNGLNPQEAYLSEDYYPVNIIEFPNCGNKADNIHPTQKPVDLLRYLVLTYTNEGDTVLDNCSGSGTTAIACIKEKRHFICFEKDETYWKKSVERVKNEQRQPTLF